MGFAVYIDVKGGPLMTRKRWKFLWGLVRSGVTWVEDYLDQSTLDRLYGNLLARDSGDEYRRVNTYRKFGPYDRLPK
jgi:hypothetical protein